MQAMRAVPAIALETRKVTPPSTATVKPPQGTAPKPMTPAAPAKSAAIRSLESAAASKKADKQKATGVAAQPKTAVGTPQRVAVAPGALTTRKTVVQQSTRPPTVRTIANTGAIREVIAPNGGVVTQGKNGPMNSYTQQSAYWQNQVLGNESPSDWQAAFMSSNNY